MKIQGKTIKSLIGATFSVSNSIKIKGSLSCSNTSKQMIGVSNMPIKVLKSLPSEFCLRELKGRHSFFLVESIRIHLIGRDLLET